MGHISDNMFYVLIFIALVIWLSIILVKQVSIDITKGHGWLIIFLRDNKDTLLAIANAIGAAGIFGAIAKSSMFLDIYRGVLTKVVTEPGHMAQRRDVNIIWTNVTKSFLGDVFPGLAEKISSSFISRYLPSNLNYCYEFVDNHIEIVSFDPVARVLVFLERTVISIQPRADSNAFKWKWYWRPAISAGEGAGKDGGTSVQLIWLSTNGNEVKGASLSDCTDPGTGLAGKQCLLDLNGSTRVERHMRRILNLGVDPSMLQVASTFILRFVVRITNPLKGKIRVNFDSVGTPVDFKPRMLCPKDGMALEELEMEYEDLMFPRQGYILTFVEIDDPAAPAGAPAGQGAGKAPNAPPRKAAGT